MRTGAKESTTLFHSGRIFDGHSLHADATAVVVRGNRVAAVTSDDKARRLAGPGAETVDLAGRLVLPGFTDAHIHAVFGGVERLGCDLSSQTGAAATLERIAEYAAISDQPWITGGGWSMSDFPGGTPGKEALDAVVADRPAYLLNRDHHGAWVNSRALELAGIDAGTPDPVDGRIERDYRGNPTGTLHEGAMQLVAGLLPPTSRQQLRDGLLAAQEYLHSHGVTGWQEAIVGDYAGHGDVAAVYGELSADGRLTAHAAGALWVPRDLTAATVSDLVASFRDRRRSNAAAGFPTTTAKIMVDGVPENRTAAMLEPYECACAGPDHGGRGLTYLAQDVLETVACALDEAGFNLHFHVIGDRAVRNGLDAVGSILRKNGVIRGRHHMAHLQVIHPADIPRFAELGVTANAQALWACNDEQMVGLTRPLLGFERAEQQYPFASLAAAGTRFAMGSDWPVSTADPWQAIHVAVNRRPPGKPTDDPLIPAEALDLSFALAAYTSGSAWINGIDDGGHLRQGAPADLVVVDRDPFAMDPEDLHLVRTDLTIVGGQVVFERSTVPT